MLTSQSSNHHYNERPILEVADLPYATARCRSSIVSTESTESCRHLFHSSLSSNSTSLSDLMQKKLADRSFQEEYFLRLSRHHRWLFVLNDYECQCGCHFMMKQGTFVLLDQTSIKRHQMISVIGHQLIRSKVPSSYVCDLDSLRSRVRSRFSKTNLQSFDL